MAQYRVPDAEDYLECPYDRTHMVRAKRFQYHLMKCRTNHKGHEFVKCPFNAKHEMPKPELRHHVAGCPDKALVEREYVYKAKMQEGDDSTLKGLTDIPPHSDMEVPQTEDWDSEAAGPVRVGVDPAQFSRVRFMNVGGMSTGEKKQMRKNGNLPNEEKLKNLMANLDVKDEDTLDDTEALRLPKSSSYAAMANRPELRPREQPTSAVYAYSIGRGRGRRPPTGSALNDTLTNGAHGGIQTNGTMNGTLTNGVHDGIQTNGTMYGTHTNGTVSNSTENIEQNGHDEEVAVLYKRTPVQKPSVQGRGRGYSQAPGLGRGVVPMGVRPPPGFGGRGRASALGFAGDAFPQFVIPKVGNSSSPYVGDDPWSNN